MYWGDIVELEKIIDNIPNEKTISDVSDLFKVLGDQTRCRILFVLEQGPLCVSDIANSINMTKYAVSHQLRILKTAKLVKCKREGKEMIYSLDDNHVSQIFECALAHVMEE